MNGIAPPNDLLQQLDDIRGLGEINGWPLAPGWWALLALAGLAVTVIIIFCLRRRAWRRSWMSEAAGLLAELEKHLTDSNAQQTAAALSVTLRRIGMRRFSRMECAGLQGEAWLKWLKTHDPRDFDWPKAGYVLIQAPYAPPNPEIKPEAVMPLIRAAGKWVR
jgi:hypothetical protein